jgi:uncharacterized protein involved in type VI secretion and phage assembly
VRDAIDTFDIATPGVFHATYLGEVTDVQDPESLGRVQIKLLNLEHVNDNSNRIWARVAVPFAGNNRGAFMLPDVGDEVLIQFVNGDARLPIVVGGLWNGSATPPETLGGSNVDRWTIVGKAGTRIAIVEESSPTIALTTPGAVSATLTDEGGGKIEIKAAGTTITVDSQGVSVQTPAKVTVQASQVAVSAGMVKVDAAMSTFSGLVKCDVLQTNTVIASAYTPGAGNIW